MDSHAQDSNIDTKALEKSLTAYVKQLRRGTSGEKVFAYPQGGTLSFNVDRHEDGSIGIKVAYDIDFNQQLAIESTINQAVVGVVNQLTQQARSAITNLSMFRAKPEVLIPLQDEKGLEKLPMLGAPLIPAVAPPSSRK